VSEEAIQQPLLEHRSHDRLDLGHRWVFLLVFSRARAVHLCFICSLTIHVIAVVFAVGAGIKIEPVLCRRFVNTIEFFVNVRCVVTADLVRRWPCKALSPSLGTRQLFSRLEPPYGGLHITQPKKRHLVVVAGRKETGRDEDFSDQRPPYQDFASPSQL
jgi:hypothetical protein